MIKRLLPIAATLLARTLRLRWSGDALPDRAVIVFWHGKMFAGWYASRLKKPVALVSQSEDGKLLASVLERWRYRLVRGSSGKKGMEALTEAMNIIRNREANRLVITPDGPRGPYHKLKRGAFVAATDLGEPLYMLTIKYQAPIQFVRSWDRFELPLPFSSVSIDVKRVDIVDFPSDDIEAQKVWLDSLSHRFAD